MVDLDIFRGKLKRVCVVTQAPVGAQISFHNLGGARVRVCNWQYSPTDLLERVEASIDLLNPGRTGLINMNGEETEMRGKVRYSKFGLANGQPYRVNADGNEVDGDSVPVFLQSGSEFQTTSWFIYADGSSRIGINGPRLAKHLQHLSSVALFGV